jgi:hypothetical protein
MSANKKGVPAEVLRESLGASSGVPEAVAAAVMLVRVLLEKKQ